MRAAAIVAALSVAATAQLPKSIPASEAVKYAGSKQTVCGPVAGLRHETASGPGLIFLDLVRAHPDQALTVAVTGGVAKNFVKEFEARARMLDVCATGRIEPAKPLLIRVSKSEHLRGFFRPAPSEPQDMTGVTRPRATWEEKPKFTNAAMRARVQGIVQVRVRIGADGQLSDFRIHKSLDAIYGLDDEAVTAAAGWKFEPARRNGQPIPYTAIIQLEFRLH